MDPTQESPTPPLEQQPNSEIPQASTEPVQAPIQQPGVNAQPVSSEPALDPTQTPLPEVVVQEVPSAPVEPQVIPVTGTETGIPQTDTPTPEVQPTTAVTPVQTSPYTKKSKLKLVFVIIAIVLVVLVLIGAVSYYFMTKDKATTNTITTGSTNSTTTIEAPSSSN